MHLALAVDPEDPTFAPEPFTSLYQRSLYQAFRGQLRRTVRLIGQSRHELPENFRESADEIIRGEAMLMERFGGLLRRKIETSKIAVHGAFHLGQVLNTGKDFVIIDLEGDPARYLSERSLKRSALRDVASMMHSFDYAAGAALRRQQPADVETLRLWAQVWTRSVSGEFLDAYLQAAKGTSFLPEKEEDLQLLLDVFLLERTLHGVQHELAARPHLAGVPILALRYLMDQAGQPFAPSVLRPRPSA